MNKQISILSDTRHPTENVGNHGLGRVAWDVAAGFKKKGYDVTLYGGIGTIPPEGVEVVERSAEIDFVHLVDHAHPIIDFGHDHNLSRLFPELPVLNYISDGEVKYQPPNTVVCVDGDLIKHPTATKIPLGIDVDSFPFYNNKDDFLMFAAKIIPEKGVDLALQLQKMIQNKIFFAGRRYYNVDLGKQYLGEMRGEFLYELIANAKALLQFTRFGDGGGRISLEAAACGTPTLCFDDNAAKEHVFDCVSGYVCHDLNEMAQVIEFDTLRFLNPKMMREWVKDVHHIDKMVDSFNVLIRNL